MIGQLKRYWIALLVIVLLGLHGTIVAVIRIEAKEAKRNASCEVDLGHFYLAGSDSMGPLRMQIHSLAPVNHRIHARQLIELNTFQIRQAIEEHLRQVPVELLSDPLLIGLKEQLLDIMIQTIGNSSVDEVLITDVRPVDDKLRLTFGAPTTESKLRMVMTRRAQHEAIAADVEAKIEAEKAAQAHGGGHGGGHGESHSSEHGESHGDDHGAAEDAHEHAADAHGGH